MLAQAVRDREPISATMDEYRSLENIVRVLESQSQSTQNVRLIGPNNEVVELPPSINDLLLRVLPCLLRGESIAFVRYPEELTIDAAADLLNVSDHHLVELCDEAKIPSSDTGALRRIRYVDLIEYKRKRDKKRSQALRELTQMSEALGLYDTPEPMPEEEPD